MKKTAFFFYLGLFLWGGLLTACIPNNVEEITVTPVVVTENNEPPTAVPTAAEIAATPIEASEETAEDAPVPPTAVPTNTLEPTVTETAVPTEVPAAAVNQVNLQIVASGLTQPLGLTHAGDERLFVLEQPGRIKIIQEGQLLADPFLDITEIANSNASEQGLLGLAFHPDYQNNGRFFVNYTHADESTIVAEYQVSAENPNRADEASERVILKIGQPFWNHNGGHITFGPDRYLYIGMGDGGSFDDPQNHAQRTDSLLGAILRIDVDGAEPYGVPADNPFVGDDNGRNELWTIGWRNPWRFSFDRVTGDMFVADVGQNVWEEVSFQAGGTAGGGNYGWRIQEAAHCYLDDCNTPNLIPPIAEYNHNEGHCSVTGGYMYRGNGEPALYGNYFFADFCSGAMWRLFPNGDGSWDMAEVLRTGLLVSSFGEGVDGELYIIDQKGDVYKLTE